MGFGGSSPPPAEPVPQVPQEDSPNAMEAQRQAAAKSRQQKGATAHLLGGSQSGSPAPTRKHSLIG